MTLDARGRPSGGRFGFGRLMLAITLASIWFLSLKPAVDPDYGWHIENGRHVLDGTVFSGRDIYSWTATGYWVVHEWLTEAVMSIVHDSLGPSANSILAALAGALAFALVALRLRRRGIGWLATVVTVGLAFFCSMMSTGVRPQVLELVYLAALGLLIDSLLAERITGKRFVLLTSALALLWTNTHGSFPLLIAVTVIAAAGVFVERDPRWKWILGAGALGAVLALVNPWGWRIYEFATQSMMSGPTLALIGEWKRPDLTSGSLVPFDIAAILAGIAAVQVISNAGKSRLFEKYGRAGVADVLVFLALLYLALTSARHVMLFGIGAAPLISSTVSRAVTLFRSGRGSVRVSGDIDSPAAYGINMGAAILVVFVMAVAGWAVVSPAAQQAALGARYPVGVVRVLDSLNRPPARMLNEYAWGGFLIVSGITPVFIDGRSELYGDEQLLRYGRIIRLSDGWRSTLDTLGVNLVVVKRSAPLSTMLPRIGWRIAAADSVGVVLTRP